MKEPFRDNCLKVLLHMIGIPDGRMGERHSLSPRSSAHSRDRHRAGSFRRSPVWLVIVYV